MLFPILASLLLFGHASSRCPPTGPVLPSPFNLDRLNLSHLTGTLNDLSNNSSRWNTSATSLAIEITSLSSTFFKHHYTAPLRNHSGVEKVASDTVFRIASVTKVFTVLAVLLEKGIRMDDPISKFVPEMKGKKWEEVTVGMLTSQLSGAPRDLNVFDLSFRSSQLIPLGFPNPSPAGIPKCGADLSQPLCTRQEFFKILSKYDLSWQPGDKAAYSDVAYILLAYALESVTKSPFTQIIHEKVTRPLDLKDTGFDTPVLSRGIIPTGMQWFAGDFGNYIATAGLFSTPQDQTKFMRAILSHVLLKPAQTNTWLKPHVFTSSPFDAVGAPWEIYRPTFLTPVLRPIDLYTKQGNLPGYSSYLILIPEYEVGVSIMVAGEEAYDVSVELMNTVVAELVPKLDEMARKQAEARYVGRYVSRDKKNNASIELAMDSGPGLKISTWQNLGKDILVAFSDFKFGGSEIEARIYPVGEDERWRLVLEEVGGGNEISVTGRACGNWLMVDQLRYAGLPVDEFDFEVGRAGGIVGVRVPGLEVDLKKI